MSLAHLGPATRKALSACVAHGVLRKTAGGFKPPTNPSAEPHTVRAVGRLVSAGLLRFTDDTLEVQPTTAGKELVAMATAGTQPETLQ